MLGADDVRRVHGFFAGPDDLIAQRRAVYGVAVELLAQAEPDAVVLDNPLVRGHLGGVLSGTVTFSEVHLRPLTDLVADGYSVGLGGEEVRLASSALVDVALRGPLTRLADELGRHGESAWVPTLVTADDDRAAGVWKTLVDGVELALRMAPELVCDLLPHIALFAVVRSEGSDRLGSASAREYPGLVVLPEPTGPLEVAEAVLHEGAHQKFFDLAMSRAVLLPPDTDAPRFRPSWAPPEAPDWPLEQAFAAFHAYVCLGVFDAARLDREPQLGLHAYSLLRQARHRAAEIGQWLLGESAFLGWQGRQLLDLLLGREPEVGRSDAAIGFDELSLTAADVTRHFGSQTLVARRGDPVELYWVDDLVTAE